MNKPLCSFNSNTEIVTIILNDSFTLNLVATLVLFSNCKVYPNSFMEKKSISITALSTSTTNTQVLFEGQLIIKNAQVIKKALLSALNNSQTIEIILRNIIKLDLAVLQLLIALQESAVRLEKKLSFEIDLNDSIRSVLHNSGFKKIFVSALKSDSNGVY